MKIKAKLSDAKRGKANQNTARECKAEQCKQRQTKAKPQDLLAELVVARTAEEQEETPPSPFPTPRLMHGMDPFVHHESPMATKPYTAEE